MLQQGYWYDSTPYNWEIFQVDSSLFWISNHCWKKTIKNCWHERFSLKGKRKNKNGKCLKWWVESFDSTIAYVSNAFTLGDKFSSLFTSSTCVKNFNHPLWVSWLCCVHEGKGRGIKDIEATMLNKRGWG